jgi:hypothetical protein
MTSLLTLFLVVLAVLPAAARQTQPTDFAYAIHVTTTESEALNQFSLPDQVYRGVTRADLGDICMFNGTNELIPFMLHDTVDNTAKSVTTRTIPLFPLDRSTDPASETLDLQVRKDAQGALIKVTSGHTGKQKHPTRRYVLDATALKQPLTGLQLHWNPHLEGTVSTVRVEGSDNLHNWQVLVSGATVINLRHGDHTIDQRAVALDNTRKNYYRITVTGGGELPQLTRVAAHLAQTTDPQPRRWLTTTVSPEHAKPGDYLFDLGGRMPVDRVRLHLPQRNTVAVATFYSRPGKSEPWRINREVLVYRITLHGAEVTNREIDLPRSTDRYRMMRVAMAGGGLGSGRPKAQWGWMPASVLFVARGVAPYRLAYGSGRVTDCSQHGRTLFHELAAQNTAHKPATAVLGVQQLLGGEAARHKSPFATDLPTALLWGALILGVALLAWMAYGLYRQMKTKSDTKDEPADPGKDQQQ